MTAEWERMTGAFGTGTVFQGHTHTKEIYMAILFASPLFQKILKPKEMGKMLY